jgi:hypothetical protein
MWDEHHTRKPRMLLRLFGGLLLRVAERALSGGLSQEPPRTTRASSQGTPQNSILPVKYASSLREAQENARRCAAPGEQQPSASVNSAPAIRYSSMGDEHHTRKPRMELRPSGG